MAKNEKTGTLVCSMVSAVKLEGQVTVGAEGVTVVAREFGRQTRQTSYYPFSQVVAYSDDGEGFVIVEEQTPVAVYNGVINTDDLSVTTDAGRVIFAGENKNLKVQIIEDNDDGKPSTVLGKEGYRSSTRFDTKSARSAEATKPKKERAAPKVGKRR